MRPHIPKKVPVNVDPLVVFVFEEMNRQRANLTDVAKRSGVHYRSIWKWKTERSPQLSHLQAVINVLGYDLVPRKKECTTDDRSP